MMSMDVKEAKAPGILHTRMQDILVRTQDTPIMM